MKVEIYKQFHKDFLKLPKSVKARVVFKIEEFEKANSLKQITNIKALKGYPGFYRARIGDYRIGFRYDNDVLIILECIGHRKDIYKQFLR